MTTTYRLRATVAPRALRSHLAPRAVTAEDCRIRFAQLDREEGSADDESGAGRGDTDTGVDGDGVVYGVAAPGVLENAGLSFAELEHKARSIKSRYACVWHRSFNHVDVVCPR